MRALCEHFNTNATLTHLNLQSTDLDNQALQCFVNSLSDNNHLISINLTGNKFNEEAIPVLCTLLDRCRYLEELYIYHFEADFKNTTTFINALKKSRVTHLRHDIKGDTSELNKIKNILEQNSQKQPQQTLTSAPHNTLFGKSSENPADQPSEDQEKEKIMPQP